MTPDEARDFALSIGDFNDDTEVAADVLFDEVRRHIRERQTDAEKSDWRTQYRSNTGVEAIYDKDGILFVDSDYDHTGTVTWADLFDPDQPAVAVRLAEEWLAEQREYAAKADERRRASLQAERDQAAAALARAEERLAAEG